VRVQGEGAGAEVARAIHLINSHHRAAIDEGRSADAVDVIIVGRGGGSTEDLWAFNEEELARAIRASAIPVISAVGHETDFTIADFAADVRAATPSAAAEIVAAREDEVAATIDALTRELVRNVGYRLVNERARLQESAMSPAFDEVRARLRCAARETDELSHRLEKLIIRVRERARRRLDEAACRLSPARNLARAARARTRLTVARAALDSASVSRLEDARARLGIVAASLDALSPLAVLQRGYAIADDEAGKMLRAARDVRVGERVRVRLASGALRCRVEEVEGAL
jgi:exodeoxyribonuclease VII large subunit